MLIKIVICFTFQGNQLDEHAAVHNRRKSSQNDVKNDPEGVSSQFSRVFLLDCRIFNRKVRKSFVTDHADENFDPRCHRISSSQENSHENGLNNEENGDELRINKEDQSVDWRAAVFGKPFRKNR